MVSTENIYDCQIKNGKFFSFIMKDGFPMIFDYSHMDRDIIVDDGIMKLGDKKEKKPIKSIAELHETMAALVKDVEEVFCDVTSFVHGDIDYVPRIQPECLKLLINQLIFDVLYDKHRDNAEMTLFEYCEYYFYFKYGDKWKNVFDLRYVMYVPSIQSVKPNSWV